MQPLSGSDVFRKLPLVSPGHEAFARLFGLNGGTTYESVVGKPINSEGVGAAVVYGGKSASFNPNETESPSARYVIGGSLAANGVANRRRRVNAVVGFISY